MAPIDHCQLLIGVVQLLEGESNQGGHQRVQPGSPARKSSQGVQPGSPTRVGTGGGRSDLDNVQWLLKDRQFAFGIPKSGYKRTLDLVLGI